MNELSLFSGAGGGVLGSKLLGHRIIGYVENNDYRQRIIAQRIKDGIFDDAPIFGDIRAFNREGYAEIYSGLVDIISGGFPCQDLSCAGKGAGIDGEKSGLWFEMATTVRIVRPRYVFIENVPTLIVRGFDRVLGSLYQMGYSAAWGIVSAADVGAPHLRKRLWILAKSGCRLCCKSEKWKMEQQGRTKIERSSQTICYADKKRYEIQCKPKSDGTKQPCPQLSGCEMADTNKDNLETGDKQQGRGIEQWKTAFGTGGDDMAETKKQSIRSGLCNDEQTNFLEQQEQAELSKSETGEWWSTERGLDRVAYGTPDRSNRLAAIGDGQVPTVAAFAFEYLRAVIERQ